MKLIVVTLICILFTVNIVKGQFIATDSTVSYGVKLIVGTRSSNSEIVNVKTQDGIVSYTPEEIKEYGFKNGVTYKSVEILLPDGNKKKYFLEVLKEGEFFNLYYLRNRGRDYYYLKNNLSQTINEVSKDRENPGYLGSLLSDVPNICDHNFKKIYLNRKFLSTIVSKLNRGICPNPAFKNYGLYINASLPSLKFKSLPSQSRANKDKLSKTKALGIGAFVEFPFWKDENLSLQFMLQYNDQQFVSEITSIDFDQDTRINLQFFSLRALPTFKIEVTSDKYIPSFFLGPVGSYYIQSEAEFVIIEKNDDWISVMNSTQSLDLFTTFGGLGGIEMKWFLNPTHFISLQFSYEKQLGNKMAVNVFQSSLKISL